MDWPPPVGYFRPDSACLGPFRYSPDMKASHPAYRVRWQRLTLATQRQSRLILALLQQTPLTLSQIAAHAGFSRIEELRRHCQEIHGCNPSQLRQQSEVPRTESKSIAVTLPIKGPYCREWVFDYLRARALSGIEEVSAYEYRRRVSAAGMAPVWVRVSAARTGLKAQLPLQLGPVHLWLERVSRLFDLNVDSRVIDEALAAQAPILRASVEQAPGLRIPGAWDGFETTVRAVLGQQVSVARGTALANRMIQRYGDGDFPTPAQLETRDIAELGMPGNRGKAISTIARWVGGQNIELPEGEEAEAFVRQIGEIKGIGPWTQNYLRLRVVKDVDAFPDNDWVVLKQLKTTPAQARAQAQHWRPWRAYALMHIWRQAGQARRQKAAGRSM